MFATEHCNRCGDATRATIMSKFNTQLLCLPCKEDERLAPGYAAADQAEVAAVRAGARNFPGAGLSAADAAFLADRRANRTKKGETNADSDLPERT